MKTASARACEYARRAHALREGARTVLMKFIINMQHRQFRTRPLLCLMRALVTWPPTTLPVYASFCATPHMSEFILHAVRVAQPWWSVWNRNNESDAARRTGTLEAGLV